jgi:hypothetical protein
MTTITLPGSRTLFLTASSNAPLKDHKSSPIFTWKPPFRVGLNNSVSKIINTSQLPNM